MLADDLYLKRTYWAYVWTRVLDTPFWGIFNLLPFILYKDLHATPFQLAAIITLKPLVSVLSSYWSHKVSASPTRLVPSIIAARWIAYLPFLAFPFIESAWYVIACFGLFMFLQVGMMPAWMELLKQNVPKNTREKVFSYTQAFGYLGGGLLPFAIGWILDEWIGAWRWMFIIAALTALCANFWQRSILVKPAEPTENTPEPSHPLLQPWKSAWQLLRKRPDFAKFQIGFMLIGSGLMIIQPALPVFFVDGLHLSYTEMGIAITLCKGISFACSSPLWVRWIQKVDLFRFGAVLAALAALFPLLLLAAQTQILWLYLAYLTYGLMQAGNELSWNLSGPMFAKHQDSSPFSSVNIIAVGVRGMFIPSIGAFCLAQFGSTSVIVMSGVLCLLASLRMAIYSQKKVQLEVV
jgi:F0F1-type ATP synthase assembly protein I